MCFANKQAIIVFVSSATVASQEVSPSKLKSLKVNIILSFG